MPQISIAAGIRVLAPLICDAPGKAVLAGAGDPGKLSPPVGSASPEFGPRITPLLRPTFARRSWSPARTLFSGQRSLAGADDLLDRFRQPAQKNSHPSALKLWDDCIPINQISLLSRSSLPALRCRRIGCRSVPHTICASPVRLPFPNRRRGNRRRFGCRRSER